MTAAAEDQIEVFGKMLQEKFDTRRIGMIGAAKHLDKELEVLTRNMFLDCWKTLDLFKETSLKTPRVKLSAAESNVIENSSILEGEQATLFRSGTMRWAYLAQDRVDISEAIKCLAQECRNQELVT